MNAIGSAIGRVQTYRFPTQSSHHEPYNRNGSPVGLHSNTNGKLDVFPTKQHCQSEGFMKRAFLTILTLCFCVVLAAGAAAQTADPLPSWNDGAVKLAITHFVTSVTTKGSQNFVPSEQRIATFDNDGTLWSEQPVVQLE
jgi:hypothetical protein